MVSGQFMNLQHEVGVNKVVQRLEENGQESKSSQKTGKCWHNPMDISLITRPSEPEQAASKSNTANHDRWKTPFRNRDVVVSCELSIISWLPGSNEQSSEQHSSYHAEVWKTSNTLIETMNLLEDNWVCR